MPLRHLKSTHLWLPPLLWAVALFLLSAWHGPEEPPSFNFPGLDKIVHAGLYAILASLLYLPLHFDRKYTPLRAAVLAFLLSGLYGISDEWHQSFVSTRSSDPMDWLADCAGAATVFISLHLFNQKTRLAQWIKQQQNSVFNS